MINEHVADSLTARNHKMINGKRIFVIALIAALFVGTAFSVATPRVAAVGDSYAGMFTSVAIDSLGRKHISSYEGECGDLRYSWQDSAGTWQTTTVDSSGGVRTYAGTTGAYTSLVLDSHNRPHISYYDGETGWVKYATQQAYNPDGYSTWTIENVVQAGNSRPAGTDQIQGGYNNWSPCHTSIALDSKGNPHISYFNALYSSSLRYASRDPHALYDDSHWSWGELVEGGNVGYANSLKFDAQDHPCISYYDAANGLIKYAMRTRLTGSVSGAWSIKTVGFAGKTEGSASTGVLGLGSDNPDLGGPWPFGSISLALDGNGFPHISYYDITNGVSNGALKYAEAAWRPTPNPFMINPTARITTLATGGVGYSNSLVLEKGQPVISYYDYTHGNLMVTKRVAGSLFHPNIWNWQKQNVDTTGVPPQQLGAYCSIAYRPPRYISLPYVGTAISYFDNGVSWDWSNAHGGDAYMNLKCTELRATFYSDHYTEAWVCTTVDGGYPPYD